MFLILSCKAYWRVLEKSIYTLARSLVWMMWCMMLHINAYAEEVQNNNPMNNDVVTQQPDPSKSAMPVIDQIHINVHPIFDESNPKENNFLYRFVNRIHINTKDRVIKKDLTFNEGDVMDPHLLKESERRLRGRRYLDDARITTNQKNDTASTDADESHTAVNVDVREVWTMIPKLTYSTAGGNTHYGYGLHDSNFLGLGKTVKIEHSSKAERTGDTIIYRDPNFLQQNEFEIGYSDNNDGQATEFSLARPFSSIRTPWSAGGNYLDFQQEDTLYNAGDEVARFGHDSSFTSVFYGTRLSSSNDDVVHRVLVGFDDATDDFFTLPDVVDSNPAYLPFDRHYKVAWVGYSRLHNQYHEAVNIQQINRIEDVNYGSEFFLRIGSVDSENMQLDKAIQSQLEYTKAFRLSQHQLTFFKLANSGFYNGGETSQVLSTMQLSYHWQNFDRGQLYALWTETQGKNLFFDKPLELGGENGLRGYPARFVAGSKSRLFTVEQRYFGETEWFSLFHMGAAVFYDEGRVWGDSPIPQDYQKTLRDVGIGLRISGTRTGGRNEGGHNITHIDLAYPLDGGDDIDKYQLSVGIKTSF